MMLRLLFGVWLALASCRAVDSTQAAVPMEPIPANPTAPSPAAPADSGVQTIGPRAIGDEPALPVPTDASRASAPLDAAQHSDDAGTGHAPAGQHLFAADVLHTIDITVSARDLAQLETDQENRVACTFTYDGATIENAGIRKKGTSTRRPLVNKPSFSVKLDEFVDGAKLDGVQKIIVNNSVMDSTFLSETLGYLVYERAGIPAPANAHAVVLLNGVAKGIYVVEQGVDKRYLRQRFGDGSGNLYEGPWDFTKSLESADLKDEEEGRARDDLGALQKVVIDAADSALLTDLAPHIDVDEIFTTMAVDMAMCLWDGYTISAANYYLYHLPGSGFFMLPHSPDWPYWMADLDPFDVTFQPEGPRWPPGVLTTRLAKFARDRFTAALISVRDHAFDVAVLDARIDEVSRVLHTADLHDPVIAHDVAGFDADVETARAFVSDRHAFLMGAF
jgi:spore coat protein H